MAAKRKAEILAGKIFAPPAAFLHKDAVSQIMKATGKTESTAKRYLNDLQGWELVSKHDDGFYRLIVQGS
jgi:DNA-binding IclR family transcriptional regulator